MKELLIEKLSELGYPVYLQGSLAENEPYPDSFITFFTIDSPDAAHYDNIAVGTAWEYQVIFYSNNPSLVASISNAIRLKLEIAGFIPQGKGRDIPSDEITHTGWVNNYLYLDMEAKNNE